MENPKIKITPELIKRSKTLTCECGNMIFQPAVVFKKLSPILSPTSKEEIIPLDVVICSKCGKVPSEFNVEDILPEEVLAKKSNIIN